MFLRAWYYGQGGRTLAFHCTLQNLRDLVSVSATHEPDVISSHILQSAFLAEEREHPSTDDWQTWNLSTRAKNMLRRLQEKNVFHAILKDHKAYSNPRQDVRISFEARRLIEHANNLRKGSFEVPLFAFLLSVFLSVVVSVSKLCTWYREGLLYFLAQIVRLFSHDQVLVSVLYVSYSMIPVLSLCALCLLFQKHTREHTYYMG